MFFMLVSASFWLLQALNDTFDVELRFPLKLTEVPSNVVITSDLPTELGVVVRDKKIGTGNDFEGTYNYECLKNLYEEHGFEYSSEYYIESEIYTVKDNPDLLCVVSSNGVFIVLEAE